MKGKASQPKYWYGNGNAPWYSRALSALYGRVVAARSAAYRRGWLKSHRMSAPVIVVGNLTVGGTGKSPLVMAIVKRLQAAGYTPGVASRGYGRTDESRPVRVHAQTPIADSGDEAAMIFHATGVPVQLDANRAAAVRALLADGCDVVVCDDGLQHYALARDIEIEVIDADRRYGNGLLLPAGPLREPAERGNRVDFRVLNWAGRAPTQSVRGLWPMSYQFRDAVNIANGRTRPLHDFLRQRVHAVTGIGHPERFFEFLRNQGMLIIPHPFPDHHDFVAADLQFDKVLPVLMTSKDAVKCKAFAQPHYYELPIEPELPEAFWTALLARVSELAAPAEETE